MNVGRGHSGGRGIVTLQTPDIVAGLDLYQASRIRDATPRDEIAGPRCGDGLNSEASGCQPLNPHACRITRLTPSRENVVTVAQRVPDAILDEVVVADGSPPRAMGIRLAVILTT